MNTVTDTQVSIEGTKATAAELASAASQNTITQTVWNLLVQNAFNGVTINITDLQSGLEAVQENLNASLVSGNFSIGSTAMTVIDNSPTSYFKVMSSDASTSLTASGTFKEKAGPVSFNGSVYVVVTSPNS